MSEGRVDAALLDAVRREFLDVIMPALDGSSRYTGAMMKRAFDVLLAQARSERPPEAVLLDAGFGTAVALARDLRSRSLLPSPQLNEALRAFVEAKLAISNPKFLAATREGPESARS